MKPELDVALSVIAYSACSASLVLLNKLILHNLPYPSLVVTTQLVVTLVFIYASKWSGKLKVDELVWEYVQPYLYYIVAFAVGVYCNMKSLTLSNVETVVVFRSLTPCLVSILDALFLGREYPTMRSWAGLFTIVLGAYGYASFDEQFQAQGSAAYFWPTLYLFVISFEMAYGKKIIRSVDLKTLSGPVLYTNLLGIPPMLLFAGMGGEYGKFYKDHVEVGTSQHAITVGVYFLIFLGCVAGTAIGYSAWWCRDKVSATTFTLIGVLNKCFTIFLNYFMWDQHAKLAGIACLFLCLVGGAMYEQAPMRKELEDSSSRPNDIVEGDDEEMIMTSGGASSASLVTAESESLIPSGMNKRAK
jgi:drug/metabolite transporter (DMT)-like permease